MLQPEAITPNLPAQIKEMGSSKGDEFRELLRERGKKDLYFLCKGILGNHKLVPHVHKPLCDFQSNKRFRRKCTVMPRGFYKTTCCTIGDSIQLIINDPNDTILWVNETQANVRRFLRKTKSYFERNQVFQWLYPEVIPDFKSVKRWSADEMEVPREIDSAEATIEVMGLGAKTSRHYHRIKFDDLVSVAAADSETLMDKAKDELAYAEPLCVNPAEDYIDYIGTRWGNDDVINHGMEEALFDAVYTKAAVENGRPLFPEQYSLARLEEIRRRIGPYKYSMLYLNDPYDEALSDFKEEWLRWYQLDSYLSEIYGEIILRVPGKSKAVRRSQLDITMTVDPAKGKKRTDARSAITVVGSLHEDRFLLEAWADHCRPEQTVAKMVQFYKVWRPRTVGVEVVGFQFMLKDEFQKVRDREHLDIAVFELKTPTNIPKEAKIRGLEPEFYSGKIYARKDQTDFLDEYRKFPTGRLKDILDSLSMHRQIWRASRDPEQERQQELEEEFMLQQRPASGY